MFRKLLLSTAFIYASVAVEAQPVFIDSVENNNIGRLGRVGEGNETYSYFVAGADNAKSKNASLVVNISSAGQDTRRIKYNIDRNTSVLTSVASNMGMVFLTYNYTTKASALMAVDYAGNITQKVPVEGVTPELAVWDNDIRLFAAMLEGYVLVLPNAQKTSYNVIAYSGDLKEQWKERYEGRGNTLEVTEGKMLGENLFLLRREQMDAKQQKYAYTLQVVNVLQHTVQMHELKDKNNNYCYATVMSEQEGTIEIAGICHKDGKFAPGLPAGIGIYEFEMNGAPLNEVYVDGKQLSNFLPDPIIASMAMNSVLSITAVVNDMSKNVYGLVGEMIQKNETDMKKQEAKIIVSDLMTMVVNKEGELQKLTLADKPPYMAISLKGSPAVADINTTANWLQKNRLVNTKGAVRLGSGSYVYVKSTDTTKIDQEAIFINIDDPTVGSRFTMAISRTPTNDPAMRPASKFKVTAGTADWKIKHWQKADIYSAAGAQIVFFNQPGDKIVLYYDDVTRRGEK